MNLELAIQEVNQKLLEAVETEIPVLQETSRHIISAGGKRIRPHLMFLCYQLAGGEDLEEAIPVAAAVELVHTATLVHDDINDHGTLRRGRVTINERWGRTFALLTGDYLFAQVYRLMAPYGDLNITLSEATVALVEGETLQAYAAKNNDLSREVYQKVVAKKTASLFRASAMLGVQLAGGDEDLIEQLGEFGFYVGLAFQIVDDILDLTGDPRVMGKQSGLDVSQGKGVASMVGHNGHSNVAVVAEPAVDEKEDAILQLKRRLVADGAVEEGQQMAEMLRLQANTVLAKLPQRDEVDQLRELISIVIERDN